MYASTNGNEIRLGDAVLELTENNIFRYVIPYVHEIDRDALLMHMITKGYLRAVKYLVSLGVIIPKIYMELSEMHGHTELSKFLCENYVPEEDFSEDLIAEMDALLFQARTPVVCSVVDAS